MKQLILIAVCFFVYTSTNAQSFELGLNLYNLSSINYGFSRDSVVNSNTKTLGPSLASIGIDYVTEKNNIVGLQYGYMNLSRDNSTTQYAGVNIINSINSNSYINRAHFLKITYGKRYYVDKLGLNSFVSLPINYLYKSTYNIENIDYTQVGTFVSTYDRQYPKELKIGLWLGQSFMYPLYKKIILGVDLHYGIDYGYTKGNFISKERQTLNGIDNNNIEYQYAIKQSKFNTVFMPVLNLKYILVSHIKDEHFKSVN